MSEKIRKCQWQIMIGNIEGRKMDVMQRSPNLF
jgi:hypothetical protein